MNNSYTAIAGYQFADADNAAALPSAAGAQNETPGLMTAAACEDDWEDAILIASELLPRLIAQAQAEGLE